MDIFEIINEKIKSKEQNLDSTIDKEIIIYLKNMLNNKYLFFTAEKKYVISSLYYIGFSKDELNEVYNEILSLENYDKYFPKQRMIQDEEENHTL